MSGPKIAVTMVKISIESATCANSMVMSHATVRNTFPKRNSEVEVQNLTKSTVTSSEVSPCEILENEATLTALGIKILKIKVKNVEFHTKIEK